VHIQSVLQVCIVIPMRGKLYTNQGATSVVWPSMTASVAMIGRHFLCNIFEEVNAYCTFTVMYLVKLGHGIVKYYKLKDGCTAARTYTVCHWYEAFNYFTAFSNV
jgi:hypothetical protein